MFQKSIAIYLALLIGIGIEPCCCFRAWISDGVAAISLAPFGLTANSNLDSGDGAAEQTKSKPSCCVNKPDKPNSKPACCQKQQDKASTDRTVPNPINDCTFSICDGCGCNSSGELDSFLAEKHDHVPVDFQVWLVDTVSLDQLLSLHYIVKLPRNSGGECCDLARLCRWNC